MSTIATAFPSVTIRKANQHAEHVMIDGAKRYTLRVATNGQKVDPIVGVNIIDLAGNSWFHPTRDDAIGTILWWHWLGGIIDG